ncbi:MAG TPA: hypothetical protein VFJ86_06405 [Usitatibacter sp.]|jgi:hypothetical protein|nr:hypothetical protein [Usitatibacter sp.]
MNTMSIAAGLAAAAFLGAAGYGLQAAMTTPPTLMSPVDYGRALDALAGSTGAALARCAAAPQDSRALCRARARTEDTIARADLDARYYGTVQAQAQAQDVHARARFELARLECVARGDDRARCLSQARVEQAKALAAAKLAAG